MVDTKTETRHQNHDRDQAKPVNPRVAIREARQRRLRLIDRGPATIKVFAASEDMRAVLRHPGSGVRFRDTLDQPVEWPNDSFTARRIKEGSVRTEASGSADMPPVDESLNARQQSAVMSEQAAKAAKTEKQEQGRDKTETRSPPKPQSPEPHPAA